GQRAQEAQAHRAADEVPEGLRRHRELHHRPPLHRGVHLRGPHGAEDPGRDGHPAHGGEEVQRQGQGDDLQDERRAGGDEPPPRAGVRPPRVPPLRRLHRRAGRHLVRRRGGHGLDDHHPALQAGRGAVRRHGAARPPRGPLDGGVRELDEGDAAPHEETARPRPRAAGADAALRPARGLPARAGRSAGAVSAPSPRMPTEALGRSPRMVRRRLSVIVMLLAALAARPPLASATDGGKSVKNTVKEAAKTGGRTAKEGALTFGRSAKAFFTGGPKAAKEAWKAGAAKTKQTAKTGARSTKEAAKGSE